MNKINVVFLFDGIEQAVETTVEQLGLNFCLNKIIADLADGTNRFTEEDKMLAKFQNKYKNKEREYLKQLLGNDLKWEYNGNKYSLVIPSCLDDYLEIYTEDCEYVGKAKFYLNPID